MEIINFLALILSERIGISPAASRGLLKLSIKDQFGPFHQLDQLNYYNLKEVILDSLKKRLENINVKEIDLILRILILELTDNQSLITIEKV